MTVTFADKLKELRQSRGMTQADLAASSSIPIGTIRDYEQGKRDPLLSNAQKLASALAVSLDVFSMAPADRPVALRDRGKSSTAKRRPRKRK